ncbi:MAG: hypothetical protein ACFB0E_21840 [Leptolyngbyaceae cyanobacterium]
MDRGDWPSDLPLILQALGAFVIFGRGIAIIVRFLTPLAAPSLAGAMMIALMMQLVSSTPFVKAAPGASGESYDNSLLYFAIA